MAGEPEWMVEAALRRRREELTRRWEERELALQRARAREKALEDRARASKRLRLDEGDGGGGERAPRGKVKGPGRREVDEEREFLIADWDGGEDGAAAEDDPLGQLSRETRALLEKVGLGGGKRTDDEDVEVEEEVKVGFFFLFFFFFFFGSFTRSFSSG